MVTDHAILRYIERVQGLDLAHLASQYGFRGPDDYRLVGQLNHDGYIDRRQIAEDILTPLVRAVCELGQGNVKTARMVAVIVNGAVVTILPPYSISLCSSREAISRRSGLHG